MVKKTHTGRVIQRDMKSDTEIYEEWYREIWRVSKREREREKRYAIYVRFCCSSYTCFHQFLARNYHTFFSQPFKHSLSTWPNLRLPDAWSKRRWYGICHWRVAPGRLALNITDIDATCYMINILMNMVIQNYRLTKLNNSHKCSISVTSSFHSILQRKQRINFDYNCPIMAGSKPTMLDWLQLQAPVPLSWAELL